MSDALRYRVRVEGRVQGVGFRTFVREQGEQLNLTGWVRNESDGAVECEIQGDAENLERMLLTLEQGPCASRVDAVKKSLCPVGAGERGFNIRY